MIKEELGAPPEELWASFDPTPIASASLAQVSRDGWVKGRVGEREGGREGGLTEMEVTELGGQCNVSAMGHTRVFGWH